MRKAARPRAAFQFPGRASASLVVAKSAAVEVPAVVDIEVVVVEVDVLEAVLAALAGVVVEQSLALTERAATGAAADVIGARLSREVVTAATARIAPGRASFASGSRRRVRHAKGAVASAAHRANSIEQQRAADHA